MARKSARKSAPTLGSLLPGSQSKLLTAKVKKMTKAQIEKAVNKHPHPDLSHKDMHSLRQLTIARINGGQSALTWSSHSFTDHKVDPQDPSTCSCFL